MQKKIVKVSPMGMGHLTRKGTRRGLLPRAVVPDAKSVYAWSSGSNTMLSIPVDGGDPRTGATLPGPIADAVVAPDGKKIVYNVRERKSERVAGGELRSCTSEVNGSPRFTVSSTNRPR